MRTKATRLVFLLILVMVADITNAETISLEQDHGIYMVPVRINNTITLPFVIDSGASEVATPSGARGSPVRPNKEC